MKNLMILFTIIGISWAFTPFAQSVERSDFEQIGIKHNVAVKYILENTLTEPSKAQIVGHVYSKIKEVLPEEYKVYINNGGVINNNFHNMIQNNPSKSDYTNYLNTLSLSSGLKTSLNGMVDLISQELPISTFEIRLKNLELAASRNLSNEDLSVFYSTTAVAKYSTRFWYPTEMGGENGMMHKKYGSGSSAAKGTKWWKVIVADAVGTVSGAAASVAATGGTSAVPVGGIPPASIVGVIAGATASANKALSDAP